MLRREVTEVRKEAQSARTSTDSEKQTKINSLGMKIASFHVTTEMKEKMTDPIKLDLSRSESHVSSFFAANTGSSMHRQLS